VFNALTGLAADTGPGARPGRVNLGVVKVPDERLDQFAALYSPKKTTHAEISFCDIAGGSNARGLDREVLTSMREMEALCQVLRGFVNPALPEPANPRQELRDLLAETLLADLEIVERRIVRLQKERGDPRDLTLLKRAQEHLEAEQPLRTLEINDAERRSLRGYHLLSTKPLLLVLNVEEDAVAEPVPADLMADAEAAGLGIVVMSALVEMDIAQMTGAEQAEFCAELGLGEPAQERFIRGAYELLDLITMFTVGPDECRAWAIRRGSTAPRAAGKIHSDMERGFIRAEVIHWKDHVELGSESKCREAGKLRVEGRDYIVQDGDDINFRFNV
jgi:hypothetical protein